MKVLAIDTSTMMATCAVLDEERLLGEFSLNQDMSHSENLIPMVKEIMDNLKLEISDIDLFAASIGPGSFTGLRIGIATVKSLAHVLDKPVVGISTLEGLAFNIVRSGIIVPMIDARRNRVYTAIYKKDGQRLKSLLDPTTMDIDELLELLDKEHTNIVVNGNAASLYRDKIKDKLKDRVEFAPISLNSPRAASIAELALIKKDEIEHNYYNLVPIYLKESQAQQDIRKREG